MSCVASGIAEYEQKMKHISGSAVLRIGYFVLNWPYEVTETTERGLSCLWVTMRGYSRPGNLIHFPLLRVHRRGLHCVICLCGRMCDGIEVLGMGSLARGVCVY